jgi:peptide chain release factor 2
MQKPGFWDDQERAASLSAEHSRTSRRLDRYRRIESELDDLEGLVALDEEDGDDSLRSELLEQVARVEQELAELEEQRLFRGRYDAGDAVVSVHSGAGGTDSQDWAEMLLRMYLRWTERRGFKREVIDVQPGDEAGIKSATFTVLGDYAYGMLLAEAGVHRLVRISPFDQAARRHTSFASVYVWPELPEDVDIEIEEKDLRVDTYRSSGAGGQHVNVTDSAVRITHIPTGIVVSCQNERSQHKNRAQAMRVLKSRLFDLRMKEQQARLEQLGGEKRDIAFGSQIRSYVLHPYQMIKDHRTKEQVGDVNRVLDGDIDMFIKSYLMKKAAGQLVTTVEDTED